MGQNAAFAWGPPPGPPGAPAAGARGMARRRRFAHFLPRPRNSDSGVAATHGPHGGRLGPEHPEAEASDRTRPFPLPGPVATKPIANRDFPQEEPPAQISSKAAPAWQSQRGGGGGPGGRRNSGKRGRVRGTLAAGATGHPTSSHPTVRTMGNSGTGSKVPRPDVSLWTAPRAAASASRRDRGHKSARRPVSAGVGTGAGGGSAAGAGGQRHGAGARPSSAGVR